MNLNSTLSTVSVVLPTLNEEKHLGIFLDNLSRLEPSPSQVIVCDAGSTDNTRALAESKGAIVVDAPLGRGCQVAAGMPLAQGDVVFIAHADMQLEPDLFQKMFQSLENSDAAGGAAGCRFDYPSPFLSLITLMNNFRARWMGISFGDQGQFVRKDALEAIGGFPAMAIMEDVEFSYRLKSAGRPVFLHGGVVASSRRWQESRKGLHALLVIRLVAQYAFLRWLKGPPVDVTPFYERYYGKRPR